MVILLWQGFQGLVYGEGLRYFGDADIKVEKLSSRLWEKFV